MGHAGNAVPEVLLNSGHSMPAIALGTAAPLSPTKETLTGILLDAIEVGYRHFDTAEFYGSEESLGLAVAEALRRGLLKSRDELFITTKLWCTHAHPDLVLPALNDSLRRLGLDHVDLYLIHWPVRLKIDTKGFPFPKENVLPFDIKGTWEAMEECSKLGLAKSIGVSNFGPSKLSQILESCTIPPAVNQIELNVAWRQEKLRCFCAENGIHVSAWSPLAANGAIWGSLAVMDSHILKDIARERGKTVPQIALRWVYQRGATPVVKTFNNERMKQNLGIFGWQLTEEELEKIEQIPPTQGVSGDLFVHENGPYKTIQQLWE